MNRSSMTVREDPDRPNNLWEPVAGDHGAHGAFDSRARSWSSENWFETHPLLFAAIGLGTLAAIFGGSTAVYKKARSSEDVYTSDKRRAA